MFTFYSLIKYYAFSPNRQSYVNNNVFVGLVGGITEKSSL